MKDDYTTNSHYLTYTKYELGSEGERIFLINLLRDALCDIGNLSADYEYRSNLICGII